MNSNRQSMHGLWSSRMAFIFAATGSAVGLGNIWKFPYIAGENGGGAFVLVYLICILCIGIPVMMSEIMLGRRGRQNPIHSIKTISQEEGVSQWWRFLGYSGVIAGFLILSYYSVIAGWALAYVFRTGSGLFAGADGELTRTVFNNFVSDPEKLLGWHTLFSIMTMVIVSRGVSRGLEKAVCLLMPCLFVLMVFLLGYSLSNGNVSAGFHFLFDADFSKITGDAILVAMGHAFFTLSLGMGSIMIYGAYMPKHYSIGQTTLIIAGMDTVVALMAGMIIFPIVFAQGLEPGAGPGLIFQTLPVAFGNMPGGAFFGALFFILLVFAAWSSAISLIEPAVTWLMERWQLSRVEASVWAGTVAWFLGLGTILSFSDWSDVTLFGLTFFDLFDYLTANIMLPLGGLLISVFVGWQIKVRHIAADINMSSYVAFKVWLFIVRFVAPLGVVVVFLRSIGVI